MENNIENSNYKINRTSNGMEKIYRKFRLPACMIKMLFKDRMQYPERFIIDIMTTASRYAVVLLLYWYVFKINNGIVNGVTFVTVAWSMFFYFSFMLFHFRDISTGIMQDVKSGNVEMLFCKPISYIAYRIWWQIGSSSYSFFTISVFASIILFFIIGFPSGINIYLFLPTFIFTLILGSILSIFIFLIIGLLAFWIEDIMPIRWMIDKAIMILGGSYLPIAFFPDVMYKMALWSPFGATQFITHTVYQSWAGVWPKLLGIQILWIIIMGIATYFMFKKVREKISVNGG